MRARAFFAACLLPALSASAADLSPLKKWIARQSDIRTIQADFVQTRSLRTMSRPLVTTGLFWFRAPADFRWQVGDPPKTIALGRDRTICIIQSRKKTAERTTGGDAIAQNFGPSFPLAKDFDDFERRFEILSLKTDGTQCRAEILPRDARARQALAKILIEFDTATGQLRSFEAVTRDGSSLRNEFQNVVVNGTLPAGVFDYDLTGYRVTDAKR